jgi:short-subunit dehydrogenase involved in D-alanine esterification of teichoic acids
MMTVDQKVAVSVAYAAAMFMTVMDAALRGIGLALAIKLKAMGNTAIIAGRRAEPLERIAPEHHPHHL